MSAAYDRSRRVRWNLDHSVLEYEYTPGNWRPVRLASQIGVARFSVLASDFTENAGALTDVGIGFTPAASAAYIVEAFLAFSAAAGTTGLQWTFAGPASGATVQVQELRVPDSGTTELVAYPAFGTVIAGANSGGATRRLAVGRALVRTGGSPSGDVTVQAQTEVIGSAITIKAGSCIRYTRIA